MYLVWAAGVGIVLPLGFFLREWLRPIGNEAAARWVDQHEGLKERLSTALELSKEKNAETSPWWSLVLRDAAGHARGLDPKRLLPLRLPSFCLWTLVLLAVGAGLGFAPEYRSKSALEAQRDKELVRDTGKNLADVVHQAVGRRPAAVEQAPKSIEALEELGKQMSSGKLTRADALKQLASLTDQMKQEAKTLANPSYKQVQDGARPTPQTAESPSPDNQKTADAMQKAAEEKAALGDALRKAKDDLAKAKQTGAGLAGQNSESAAKARQELGQQLANLSKKLADLGQGLPDLNDAIEALKNSQTDMFLKDLDVATVELDKMQAMAEAMAKAQAAGEKMGKDLEERLKFGQAEGAQQRLDEIIRKLQDPSMGAEQMKKLMEEVQRSVDPGKMYGKAGECLNAASASMKAGDKAGAAKSLAQAAKELDRMMAEAKEMKLMMAVCDKAGECLGNKMSWSQCNSRKAGKGGRPGRGVGTWADEDNWFFNPGLQQYVDNSDIKRPDTAPRGNSDRGDGELPENLSPTKLHGKFSPGGPMPSITLKGVSIKGKSTVAYQEAASAAQSAAESALNQDQVPHAYQGAVKDYFNDLKK
jgi:hypothetical protein